MSNPITQTIAAIASLFVLMICYVVFGPMINDTLYILAKSYIIPLAPSATLLINQKSLMLTADIVIMGFKVFTWFVIGAVFFRLFLWIGFLTEEQAVY